MNLTYLEDFDSKIPAIQLLCALGWQYLGRDEAVKYRNGRLDQVVLTGVLRPWLAANACFEVKGKAQPFSEANIYEAVRRLTDEPFNGLVRTNEKIYHLLTLGTSLEQMVDGDRKGRSLHYLDWKNWRNNVYHVTDAFVVERAKSHDTARPDLVLFVNGIPFVVIECKRRDKDKEAGEKQIDVAIEQMLRFDVDAFDKVVEEKVGTAAKADTIASRTIKTIREKMDEDPVFYKKFADLVQQAIDDYRSKRISDAEYLHRVKEYMSTVRRGHDADLPKELTKHKEAPAFYGVVDEILKTRNDLPAEAKTLAAEMAISIQKIVDVRKKRDWPTMEDVIKDMQNDLDDYLFDLEDSHGLKLSTEEMDAIIERCISVAKKLAGYDA